MKEIIKYIFLCLSLPLLIFVTSCDLLKSEDDIINKKIEKLISSLENNDKEGLKKMFSKEKIDEISNFDNSLDELLEYYDGELTSKSAGGKGTDKEKNDDYQATWYNLAYKVTTSTEQYRIAIYWCTEYSSNKNEVGIWSLYIINEEEYFTPEYTYRGDGLWTPGINIGKVYEDN